MPVERGADRQLAIGLWPLLSSQRCDWSLDLRVFLGVIFLLLLGYGLAFVLFVSSLPPTPVQVPKADGIVALDRKSTRLNSSH